jgi:hypothetical protein
MTTVIRKAETTVPVTQQALDKARTILRAVAAGEPVDTASMATLAAYALAALPTPRRAERFVA